MTEWASFFSAQVTAAAALAGLIFVGVSINLTKIIQTQTRPDRALEALVILISVLISSSLLLIPKQTAWMVGRELLVVGLINWVSVLILQARASNFRRTVMKYTGTRLIAPIVFSQLATFPPLVAAVVMLTGNEVGLYVVVPGIIFSYIAAIYNAWVLLIEINR